MRDENDIGRAAVRSDALRAEAYRLLASAESLEACCARKAGGNGIDLVGAWTDMMSARDRSPEDWPVAGILGILEDAVTGGDLAAARLIGPVRRIHKGMLRFRQAGLVAEDPRLRTRPRLARLSARQAACSASRTPGVANLLFGLPGNGVR